MPNEIENSQDEEEILSDNAKKLVDLIVNKTLRDIEQQNSDKENKDDYKDI